MRINSAKQAYALHFMGIMPNGDYGPKTGSQGKVHSNDELLIELAIIMSPFKHLSELHRFWAEYVYADVKPERLFWLKGKICAAVDDYSFSFVERVNVDTYWKITRINELIIENFRESERNGRRLYADSFYYLRVGVGSSNYAKSWKERSDEVSCYLDCLSRRVLTPIAEKISELKERELSEAS